MNNKEQALDWIEKAAHEHSSIVTTLIADPVYDSLPMIGNLRSCWTRY